MGDRVINYYEIRISDSLDLLPESIIENRDILDKKLFIA